MKKRASIIIPTYNRYPSLADLVRSLDSQAYDKNEFEVLIIDNNSSDETKDCHSLFGRLYPDLNIRYYLEPVPGLLSGRHKGALSATGDILIFVDDDIIADAQWLTSIMSSFEKHPEINFVGGRSLPIYKSHVPDWIKYFWQSNEFGRICGWLSLVDFGDDEKLISIGYVYGLNYAIRRETLWELGGFHPDNIPDELQYFQGDGESGLSYKGELKGMKALYQPKALVYHQIPANRLTYAYFERRGFYQGVCNSYANIRWSRSGLKPKRNDLNAILRKFKRYSSVFITGGMKKAYLFYRFEKKAEEGYNYHQKAVSSSRILYDWVMKEDYWDYQLPNIK